MAAVKGAKARLRQLLAEADGDTVAERVLRMFAAENCGNPIITPDTAYELFLPLFVGQEDERLAVMGLDRRRKFVAVEVLTVGSDGFTVVEPRQVYRWALRQIRPVSAILIAHNHPSGDATPSSQDQEVTRRVAAVGRLLGIPLLDHLVICDHEWESMARRGELPAYTDGGPSWTT
jgi:DNA repair protein RadC